MMPKRKCGTVAFVYPGDPSGRSANPLSAAKNAEALVRQGWQVLYYFPCRTERSRALVDLEVAFRDFGIRYAPIARPIATPVGLTPRSFSVAVLARLVASRPNVVWSRDIFAACWAVLGGLDVLVEHHTLISAKQSYWLKKAVNRHGFRGFLAISEAHRQLLVESGFAGPKVHPLHSGVSLELEDGRLETSNCREFLQSRLGGRNLIVLYSGSLYQGRGQEFLLRAARELPEIGFAFLGGRAQEVQELSIRAQGLPNVAALGRVPACEVPGYLRGADILVAPFEAGYEAIDGTPIHLYASPLKVMDYLAAGRCIITVKMGAIPEVIQDGRHGLLVAPGSSAEFVAAIRRAAADSTLRNELGENARKRATEFSWDSRVRRAIEICRLG